MTNGGMNFGLITNLMSTLNEHLHNLYKKRNMATKKTKLKSIPVYLPEEKHKALHTISENKRQPITRLVELEIDKLIKRESTSL